MFGHLLFGCLVYYLYVQIEIVFLTAQQLRKGVYEAVPQSALSQLSAEDLRLLLCGCPHIEVDVVRGITVFEDESRKYICKHIYQSVLNISEKVCILTKMSNS